MKINAQRVFMLGSMLLGFHAMAAAPSQAAETLQLQSTTLELQEQDPGSLAVELLLLGAREHASHLLVRFHAPPTRAERALVESHGLQLLSPMGPGGWMASIQPGFQVDALSSCGLLAEVREIDPAWKLHWSLAEGLVPTWTISRTQQDNLLAGRPVDIDGLVKELSTQSDPIVAVYVMLHPDMPLRETGDQLALATNAFTRSRLESINGLVLELPYSAIWTLAEDDRVLYIEPALPQMTELNNSNRIITQVDEVQEAPYELCGEGVVVMVYDGGYGLASHGDFGGRLTVRDDAGLSDHATHVAGTIGGDGSGSSGNYRGMAPCVEIQSYGFQQEGGLQEGFLYTDPGDLEDDYGDAINNHGAVIANNSIGTNTAPNGFPCEWTGDYGVTSNLIDAVVTGELGAPMRIVWANGNERQTDRCGEFYHTTAPPACAKNHITMGALNSNDDSMTYFSSWGPADDGRIKPDLSGPGCQSNDDGGVTSCSSSGGYNSKCGTSMSCPTATGLGALIIEDYRAQYPELPEMANSTLKVLLAQSAFDGGNPGPDCQYGFGSVRVRDAIDLLRTGSFLETGIGQDETYDFLIVVEDGEPQLQITAAWDDVPATPLVIPSLVNDIDLVVHGPDGTRYYPWTIDPSNPGAPATQDEEDHLNNMEQVTVNSPEGGIWLVSVRGTVVTNDEQLVSIAATPELIDCSSSGIIGLDRSFYPLEGTLGIRVVDCDLNTDDEQIESLEIDVCTGTDCETLVLVESGAATSEFTGTIPHSVEDADGVLQTLDGDTIVATYEDESDIDGNPATANDTAIVDGTPPEILLVELLEALPREVTIRVTANEVVRVTIDYGPGCEALIEQKTVYANTDVVDIRITGLEDNTEYSYTVTAEDRAGNVTVDDNGGSCFIFVTPDIPDFLTESFGGGFDLDGKSIMFTPTAAIDRYDGCIESISALPVDPSGGSSLPLSDDDYESVSPSQPVIFFEETWNAFYVGSNGFITFGSGDTDYTEDIGEHFELPRISALWDDLNPSSAGLVSWKETAASVVVTWQNVPQYGNSDSNTFQCELFFDGSIRLSWYGVSTNDAIVGLSPGGGTDPDFVASDLSEIDTGCGPNPPVAEGQSIEVVMNQSQTVTLSAADDGLPDPPGALSYVILTLPQMHLRDTATGTYITAASLPYTLESNLVDYVPYGNWEGEDMFQFAADDGGAPPEGGQSEAVSVNVTVNEGHQVIYQYPMDSDPGWVRNGQWEFGQPLGGGGSAHGYPDPTSGATGAFVMGYNLAGDYANNIPEYHLTTSSIDCTGLVGTELHFMRWLNVEQPAYDHARLDVSANGGLTWTTVWENSSEVTDDAWASVTYDLSSIADGASAVKIRWTMGTTDAAAAYSGWNIDDVEILGTLPADYVPGDINNDGTVNVDDLLLVISSWGPCQPPCPADTNGDFIVNIDDLLFVLANWNRGGSPGPAPPSGDGPELESDGELVDEAEQEEDIFINDGVLAPADEGGLVHVDSDFLQTADGVLEIELVNLIPIEGHDVLSVSGTITLDGGLAVRAGDGFNPRAGDRYAALVGLEIHGEFAWTGLPDIGDDLELVVCFHSGAVILEVRHREHGPGQGRHRPRPEADINLDGIVDARDLLLILETWAHGEYRDLDGDGRFTPMDILLVLQHMEWCNPL